VGELDNRSISILAADDLVGRCYCVRLDRFGYATGYTFGSTICWVKDVNYHLDKDGSHSLILATVDYFNGPSGVFMRFVPLALGDYSIWRSGWMIQVTDDRFCSRTYDSLHVLRCVPIRAFRGLKLAVRLLHLSRRLCVQESPLRFCGGREVVRLSQTALVLRDVAVTIHPGSFQDIIAALAGRASGFPCFERDVAIRSTA